MRTCQSILSILTFAMGMFVCGSSPLLAVDCQPNGIDDECDLDCAAQGGACNVAGCGESADCNTNGVPDECDTDFEWTGLGGDASWNNSGNWCPAIVPDDPTFDVTISGVVTVDLDISPTVNSLIVEQGATLNVTAAGDVARTLTIGSGGLQVKSTTSNTSTIIVLNDSTIDASDGSVIIGPNGAYRTTNPASCPESSGLVAASITIMEGANGGDPPGDLRLDCEMTVTTTGNFKVDGTNAVAGGSPAFGPGCTPPIIKIDADSVVSVGGDLSLINTVDITIDSTAGGLLNAARQPGTGARIELAGNFDNRSTAPDLFDATKGAMVLNGSGSQTFEVAGALLESPTAVFQNNFSFGSLTVSARPLSETVTFQDAVDNVPGGTGPLEFEWFFVNGLTLENVTLLVLRSGVAFDALVDPDPNAPPVTVKGEGAFTSIASLFSQVPTASQWGVIVLVLALLTAATIGIRRYRRAAA